MNDKIIIRYDVFETGENVATFTFDEPTEERNITKLAEALELICISILKTSKAFRELKLAGVDITSPKGAKFKLSSEAGSNVYKLTPIKQETETSDEAPKGKN